MNGRDVTTQSRMRFRATKPNRPLLIETKLASFSADNWNRKTENESHGVFSQVDNDTLCFTAQEIKKQNPDNMHMRLSV